MKSIRRLMNRLERRIQDENSTHISVVVCGLNDLVAEGYFADEDEQESYTRWRIRQVERERSSTGENSPHYKLIPEDITRHIEAFRAARNRNEVPGDDGRLLLTLTDYRGELL